MLLLFPGILMSLMVLLLLPGMMWVLPGAKLAALPGVAVSIWAARDRGGDSRWRRI